MRVREDREKVYERERERERKRKRKKEREGVYVWPKEIFLSLMETNH